MTANFLVLDFETYYDGTFSLKKMSTAEYVGDPRFKVHGLAIRWPNGKKEFRRDVEAALAELQAAFGPTLDQVIVVCHNSYFDLFVLSRIFDVHPAKFIDTMLLSNHVHGPKGAGGGGQNASLKALAERYGLNAKGSLDFMKGVREPDVQQLAELEDYACNDVELTYQLALHLIPYVSRPEKEFPIMMHTVRLFTERMIRVDVDGISALQARILNETERWLEQVKTDFAKKEKTNEPANQP